MWWWLILTVFLFAQLHIFVQDIQGQFENTAMECDLLKKRKNLNPKPGNQPAQEQTLDLLLSKLPHAAAILAGAEITSAGFGTHLVSNDFLSEVKGTNWHSLELKHSDKKNAGSKGSSLRYDVMRQIAFMVKIVWFWFWLWLRVETNAALANKSRH